MYVWMDVWMYTYVCMYLVYMYCTYVCMDFQSNENNEVDMHYNILASYVHTYILTYIHTYIHTTAALEEALSQLADLIESRDKILLELKALVGRNHLAEINDCIQVRCVCMYVYCIHVTV